jgi:hypothetical protein
VWADVMNEAVKLNYKSSAPKAEPVVAKANLCRVSGLLATDSCVAHGSAYSEELPYELVPQAYCTTHGGGGPVTRAERREGSGIRGFFNRLFR